jgi:LysR family cyn operon transcriptional activator
MRSVWVSKFSRTSADTSLGSVLLADEVELGIGFAGRHLPGISAKTQFTETLSLVFGAHQSMRRRDRPLSNDL